MFSVSAPSGTAGPAAGDIPSTASVLETGEVERERSAAISGLMEPSASLSVEEFEVQPEQGETRLLGLLSRLCTDVAPEGLAAAVTTLARDGEVGRLTALIDAGLTSSTALPAADDLRAWLGAVTDARRDGRDAGPLYAWLHDARDGTVALALGRWFRQDGSTAEALAWYDRVAERSAQAEARFEKGELLARLGRLREAVTVLATADASGHPDAFARAAELATQADEAIASAPDADAGDWLETGELYALIQRLWPERIEAMVAAARCFHRAGAAARVEPMLRLIEEPEVREAAISSIADALLEDGDFDGAVALLAWAVRAGSVTAGRRYLDLVRGSGEPTASPHLPRLPHADRFPVLDTGISDRGLLNRLTAGADRRRLIGTLDHTAHRPATEEGIGPNRRVRFDQVGWPVLDRDGRPEPLLMGVVAIRGRILSDRPLDRVTLVLKAASVASGRPSLVRRTTGKFLYAFNLWFDADRVGPCRGELELWAEDVAGGLLTAATIVNVIRAPVSLDLDDSDSFLRASDGWADVTNEILSRPPLVRSGLRTPFPRGVREILVMRVDQLGDLSATLPAIARMRELFPGARITGLVSKGLREILEATGLCDDVLDLTLVYDHVSERRYLREEEQERVTVALDRHDFDIAVDFCPADETRALLKLVNARYLVGFNPREFGYLDLGVDIFTRDKMNQAGIISHSAYVSVLVEALAAAMRPSRGTVPRLRDDTALLASHGLVAKRYVVVHSGARHPINCWPIDRFMDLSQRLVDHFGLKVVFFADDRPSTLPKDERIVAAGRMPIDAFDALMTNAALMVGNDSGPKHLAAVRGVPTVSIHVNRLNWREWGQEGDGLIIAKKVPCCGCGLNNLAMCAKDAACITSISVDQVFDAIVDYMAEAPDRPAAG